MQRISIWLLDSSAYERDVQGQWAMHDHVGTPSMVQSQPDLKQKLQGKSKARYAAAWLTLHLRHTFAKYYVAASWISSFRLTMTIHGHALIYDQVYKFATAFEHCPARPQCAGQID